MGEKRKRLVRRLKAMILACSMIFGLLPGTVTTAWADENENQDQGQEDMILYDGEDGLDYIGYSGCYISREAYQQGNIWISGGFPKGVYYWVHGTTIQDVVDKLLELDGQTCKVWDIKKEEHTEVTIENSGFIYLNMSYRDSSYKDAVEAEQYVYAPASIKGILMDTASNPYSIPAVEPRGTQIKEDNGRQVYNDVYEFPLTKAAQNAESMKAYKLDGNATEISYDATDGDIKYLHGIVLPVDYVNDFSEYFKNLTPKMTEGKRLIQKTTYDSTTDSWKTEQVYYLISAADIVKPADVSEANIEQYGVLQKDPHRWPSLHVNASTQVYVRGLWTENANLYIGFYDGVDSVNTYVDKEKFTYANIGLTQPVTYASYSTGYDPAKNRIGEEQTNDDNQVTVHVVKAESNTNIQDTYSEGGQTAAIDVDKEAISDFVPMDDNEKKALIDGASLDLNLEVSGVDVSSDATVVKAQNDIRAALESGKQADFFNAVLNYTLKKKDGTTIADNKSLTEMKEDMVLSFPLKAALKGRKNYVVYRYHNGKVEKLHAWIDKVTGNLCFETDRFSVYAIAADDETSGGGASSGGGSSSGGGAVSGGGSATPGTKPDDGTSDVKTDGTKAETTITQIIKDKEGKTFATIEVNAGDLKPGKKLTLVRIDENGKKILVSKSVVVDENGNFTVDVEQGEYQLLNAAEAKSLRKEILSTLKPAKKKITLKDGKKTTIKLNKKSDMDNVASVTYRSDKKSVASVNKKGKVTSKKPGMAIIEITIVLNDGTKKVLKVPVTVKK